MAENSKIEWTDHTFNPWMCRIGKKRAGHMLDGQEWRQMPEVAP